MCALCVSKEILKYNQWRPPLEKFSIFSLIWTHVLHTEWELIFKNMALIRGLQGRKQKHATWPRVKKEVGLALKENNVTIY